MSTTPQWRMPAESEPHERAWMAWPSASYTLGESASEAEEAWVAWAAVANAISEHEPISVLVDPSGRDQARRRLSSAVEQVDARLDDAWYRDIGPTFVVGADPSNQHRLGAVNWVFNGWGQQEWATWEHDARASGVATEHSGAVRIDSPMVNEGGGIHTDGLGTFLVTETVQLDPDRNPGWTKADVEAELVRTVGARKVIWLPRGLTRDSERFGTRGHVDIIATFTEPGRLLVHDQRDGSHPDVAVTAEVVDLLSRETDADGRPLEVVRLPAPKTLVDDAGWVDYSYVNHFVLNGAVVACSFDDPVDAEARDVIADAYPGRSIVTVDARALFARGGGVHCITQQQPAVPSPTSNPGGTP
ncbi:agmatine deiminase family protein [Nocardioides immobilis]|nr:agmatine deiminase family protein [Nocardioides immobilis]